MKDGITVIIPCYSVEKYLDSCVQSIINQTYKNLEVNGKCDFTGDITANNIKVDNLTVNKLAHFFQLVIDEVKSSQGQIIITEAHAKIDYVEKVNGGTVLWWR